MMAFVRRSLAEGMADAITSGIAIALGPPMRRCAQCWQFRKAKAFISEHGRLVKKCPKCRRKYDGWQYKSLEKRTKIAGSKHPSMPIMNRVGFAPISQNKKTGPIPVSTSEPGTCPPSCALYDKGCYALYGKLSASWRKTGERGLPWNEFLTEIASLPVGQLWRHNQAGDLAGEGDAIDGRALDALIRANAGRRGFTFTHKPVLTDAMATPFRREQDDVEDRPLDLVLRNRRHVRRANRSGFTVNLSADSLEHADALAALKIAPVTVVLPEDAPRRIETPKGNLVIVCPAQMNEMTCATCALCAKPQRKAIVGFRAHGQFQSMVSELVRSKRTEAA